MLQTKITVVIFQQPTPSHDIAALEFIRAKNDESEPMWDDG